MPTKPKNALNAYRRRLKREGIVRLEVHVRKEDASLVRGIVHALGNADQRAEARATLRRFGPKPKVDLKTLLASAPLEGIDLSRDHDLGRDVDL